VQKAFFFFTMYVSYFIASSAKRTIIIIIILKLRKGERVRGPKGRRTTYRVCPLGSSTFLFSTQTNTDTSF
jgi:hypothetical protein